MNDYAIENMGHREPSLLDTLDINERYYNAILGYVSPRKFKQAMEADYTEMILSVVKYKGFYVSRYEMSLSNESSEAIQSKSDEKTTKNIWYELYNKAKNYTGSQDSVQSSMIWGSQYDAMLNWMQDKGVEVCSKTPNGAKNNTSMVTGSYESDKIKNVYDLLGCCYEYTLEAYYKDYRVYRGTDNFASNRGLIIPEEKDSNSYHGTRFTLYIK